MFKDCLFVTISDGHKYEYMSNNLFKSLKYYNKNITTLHIGFNNINYADLFLNVKELYSEHQINKHNLNDFNIGINSNIGVDTHNHVGYSFKLGLISKIPQNILNNYKKIIYLDSDAECVDEMFFDESIRKSKIYAAWDQSIITQNLSIMNKINLNWSWNGKTFERLQKFAQFFEIKEWKNVNGGLYIIDTSYIELLINNFIKWNQRIKDYFYDSKFSHNDEFVMSLILAEEEGYYTPDISRNGICQINLNENFENIKINKFFKMQPWFFTNNEEYPIHVKATCVHSPNSKNLFSKPI